MDITPRFPDRLQLARRRAGLDQEALAKKAGMTRYTLGRLERGQAQEISIEALRRLARALEVSTDWLLAMDVENGEASQTEQEENDTESCPPRPVTVESV